MFLHYFIKYFIYIHLLSGHDLPHVGGSVRGRLQDLQLVLILLQPHPHRRLHRMLPHMQNTDTGAAIR